MSVAFPARWQSQFVSSSDFWRSPLRMMWIACLILTQTAAAESPNFVVIFTDDQGYQDVGCFGSPDIRTPRLDTMAAEGMKFTSFYAQPICGPSRAALMTGCYPLRVAERGHTKQIHPILHEDEVTIAEVLKTRGYATACFGKWDLAKHSQSDFFIDLFPTRQGFDYFYGTPTSNDRIANLYRNEELIERETNLATLTKRYTDEAIEFIEHNKNQPFFVYIPHTMPHTKLDASAKFKGKSKRGLYGDVIEEIDFNVGRILDALEELKLADNTYVLFTSDNGPWLIKNKDRADGSLSSDHGGSAGPLRSGKVSTFEGGVRVPTILWGPGRVPAGTTCDSIATTMDVLPTLAALAAAETPADRVIDGEDIRHLFHGEFDKANTDKAYFYYLRVHLQAVRQGNWKLHLPREKEPMGAAPFSRNTHIAPADRIGFNKPFLVNLDSDIGETTNVAMEHPQVVARLMALAESMREDLGDFDRVGKNMRFFDAIDARPQRPPVPAAPKQANPKPQPPRKNSTGYQSSVPPPTLSNIRYGKHKRNVLDFWRAESKSPTPLVFVIHGGGWRGGSKELIHKFVDTKTLLKAGISVAAINYRYTTQAGNVTPPVRVPLYDAARALQFVRSKAHEWNIDKQRIGAAGGSAGACSSLWLAFHDNLADPASDDAVLRESTRLWCAAVVNAQTSLDPQQMKQWIPNSRYGGHAFGKADFAKFLTERDSLLPWIKEYSPYALVTQDDPPVYIRYGNRPAIGSNAKDPTHSANFGVKLQEHCAAVGSICEVAYPDAPDVRESPTEFLIQTLKGTAP